MDKWPIDCVAMGDIVGPLSEAAARHLGLPDSGIPVTQGGPDAYVGMIGLGSIDSGELSLITGSSHLHLAISDSPLTAKGIWGAYRGAPLIGLCFAEGGQSSTGSVVAWMKRLLMRRDRSGGR
jgi:ribulose kinase